MVEFLKDIGNKITCMVKVSTNGLTVENMKEATLTTENTDMEYIFIQMADAIKATGIKVNNMAKVNS